MKEQPRIHYVVVTVLAVLLVVNTVMVCMLTLWLSESRKSLINVEYEIQELKRVMEDEIRLRQELFPQLKKSAKLLRHYNRRLDRYTALAYALKIYQCSDEQVTPEILTALIVVESSAVYDAVSSKGALGLTQVMPNIWNVDHETLTDPYQNIEIGSSILKYYIGRHGLEGGLSAYNSGKKYAAPKYAHKVLTIAERSF
jgi:soluble lytic murein transglycosylase-like protein